VIQILKKMHALQPKHSKLSQKELAELLEKFNISLSQLPKIKKDDAILPKECDAGDVIEIERATGKEKVVYYRVVVG